MMQRESNNPLCWKLLTDEENAAIWDRFIKEYGFRLGTDPINWPGICEPENSVTFDATDLFSTYYANREQFYFCETELQDWLLNAVSILSGKTNLIALSLNHDGYRSQSFPSTDNSAAKIWPVWIAPIGEYVLFFAPDLQVGIFGHPWERTICVFGMNPLEDIFVRPPKCLHRIKRLHGTLI